MKLTLKNVPILFSNCKLVRGHNRSAICDLQNFKIHLIPNDLFHILRDQKYNTISEIFKVYNNKFNIEIKEYFEYLHKLGLIFFSDINTAVIYSNIREIFLILAAWKKQTLENLQVQNVTSFVNVQ